MNEIFKGVVIHGDGYGKKIGFPTANIDREAYTQQNLNMELGIYAGEVELPNGARYKAGIVIGPIGAEGLPKLEAHLIDFSGSLYGQKIIFYVQSYLRAFKKYGSEEELKLAIQADIEKIKRMT